MNLRVIATPGIPVDYNGYKFKLVTVSSQTMPAFYATVPLELTLLEGDIICCDTAEFTRAKVSSAELSKLEEPLTWAITGKDDEKYVTCIRMVEAHVDNEAAVSKYIILNTTGLIIMPKDVKVIKVGINSRPFLKATLRVRDSYGKHFSNLLVAFRKNANQLAEHQSSDVVKMEVTVKPQKVGYCLVINYFIKEDLE